MTDETAETLPDPSLCRRIAKECRENASRPLLMRALEIAIDEALGEVARQQGGITPPTSREARNAGIDSGRAALSYALRLIMSEAACQLEAAANLVERTEARQLTVSADSIREAFEAGFATGLERGNHTCHIRAEVTHKLVREDLAVRERALKDHMTGLAERAER